MLQTAVARSAQYYSCFSSHRWLPGARSARFRFARQDHCSSAPSLNIRLGLDSAKTQTVPDPNRECYRLGYKSYPGKPQVWR